MTIVDVPDPAVAALYEAKRTGKKAGSNPTPNKNRQHAQEARARGERRKTLDCLLDWRGSPMVLGS